MQLTRPFTVVGATLVALTLVAHLWMLDAPMAHGHGPPVGDDVVLVATSSPGGVMTGCPTGMDACRVPLPVDPLLLLFVSAVLLAVHHGRRIDRELVRMSIELIGTATERAPPKPPVPSSVVLLE